MVKKIRSVLMAGLLFGIAGSAWAEPLVQCRADLDRGVLPAGPVQKTVIKIALDTPLPPQQAQRPAVNLALVLDRSGSMSGSKLVHAREAAVEALHRLAAGDLFSLVAYDDRVEALVPARPVGDLEGVEARIRGIRPGGSTALFGAVSQGAAEVRRHGDAPYVHRVLLLSDGLANVGPSEPGDLARLGASLLKEGISVSTVGVGTDFNEDLMTALAERSDGNHYFVESSRDLPRIFASELGDVLSVVARKVVIEVTCPPGVKPLRIIGREGSIRGRRVEVRMNQLYGGQQKYALLEVEVPASQAQRSLDLAKVTCRYRNALADRDEASVATVQARFSNRPEDVRGAVNREVQEAVVKNEMAVARDQALSLYNEGRKDEAVRTLRRKGQSLQEQNAAFGLDALASEAEQLQEDAAAFAAEELDAPRKKALRSESFKVRKQQKAY